MCTDTSLKAPSVQPVTKQFSQLLREIQLSMSFPASGHWIAQAHLAQPVLLPRQQGLAMIGMEWGLIADYMNTPEKIRQYRNSMVNARSERILDHRSAWFGIRHQRCLVPVTGIYEHRHIHGFKKKVPYHIKLSNQPFFLLPALYHYPLLPNKNTGELTGTFTLVTCTANALMQQIHNHGPNQHRMPLFLHNQQAMQWLDTSLKDNDLQHLMQISISPDQLEAWPVYRIRGAESRPDGQEKDAPYQYPGLPHLFEPNTVIATQQSLF